jgi:hypothetical protein
LVEKGDYGIIDRYGQLHIVEKGYGFCGCNNQVEKGSQVASSSNALCV